MFSGTAAAAAAATAGGSGLWLFSYNKENYGFDTGMRFGRFMMARGNANAQVGQYREDIQGIVGATVSKMDAWQTVTTLFLAVGAALSCAGRIGMHGCAPPGWYCALFSGSIFMSVLFNGVSLWLSMHAALRAQCASVSLLTRKVRLPIPSIGQLDQARVFGSSFEKQNARDIFRIPFMRHTADAPNMPHTESDQKKGKKAAHDPTKEFASTARDTVPSWIRDEVVVDKGDGFMGTGKEPVHDTQDAPEHFKLLMKAQEEWRDYDVYARISMLYGVCSFLYAVTYYASGTAIIELRGFWVMWTLPLVFMTAQALIMRLDILQTGQHRLPKAELFGHLAPFFAVAACTLEYRYFYSEASVTAAWGLALLAVFAHFVMALRWLDLAWPDEKKSDMPEEAGRQWWPGSWRVPSAFTKHLWFITPPKKLDPEVAPCLLREMEDMAVHGGGVETCRKRKGPQAKGEPALTEESDEGAYGSAPSPFQEFGFKRSHDLPWQLMRIVISTVALQWLFIMVTTTAEVILGPESLLKPPGEPPWIRDTKYRHYTPSIVHHSTDAGLPAKYRLFSASRAFYSDAATTAHSSDVVADPHAAHADAAAVHSPAPAHRRLLGEGAMDELLKLVPELSDLLEQVSARGAGRQAPAAVLPVTPGAFMAGGPKVQRVAWPALFEPRHLLCPPAAAAAQGVVALTSRGAGAMVPLGRETEAELFSLEGIGELGPLAGGSWGAQGLQLITVGGQLLHCEGHNHAQGRWPCRAAPHAPLPLAKGAQLLVAAVSDSEGSPRVALVHKGFPGVAALYRLSADSWQPEGEVHLPPQGGRQPGLAFDGADLLVTYGSGEVHRRAVAGPTAAVAAAVPADGLQRDVRAACAAQGNVLRLAVRQSSSSTWLPELILA